MTKISKTKINARRKEQSAERKVKSAQRQLSHAQLETQIAELEAQIALLKGESQTREDGRLPTAEGKKKSAASSPEGRIPLPTPVLGVPTTMGDSVFLRWGEIPGANSIEVQLAYDAEFTKPSGFVTVDGTRTWATLTEMPPDATFFFRLIAVGDGTNNSAYSNVRSVRTLPEGMAGTSDEIPARLQSWLDALRGVDEQFFSSLSQFANVTLTPAERRRALGSGVRRYGFIDKVSDTAEEFPQFWPAYFDDQETLKERLREIEVLRNLLVFFESGARVVLDMLLTAGNDAFQIACVYYRSVRNAAREQNPEGEAVFQLLRLFWNRRRSLAEEPTERQLLRDASALMHGKKEGKIFLKNESPTTSGGVHVVIDDTVSRAAGRNTPSRGGARGIDRSPGVVQRGETE